MRRLYPPRNFNPRPPRGGRLLSSAVVAAVNCISIHAPREGGDASGMSTRRRRSGHFNPRPPRGGRRRSRHHYDHPHGISIHAPREGGDPDMCAAAKAAFEFQSTPPARGATPVRDRTTNQPPISIHAPREGGDSKDAQFYLRIFDKQVELLRFLGIIRGGCLRNPEKDRRFLGKSLANLPEISGHLDFAGGGKARPGYPCAVPLPRRAACVRGSGDPPADRCSSYRNAPLFSHIASLDSKSADCLSQNP